MAKASGHAGDDIEICRTILCMVTDMSDCFHFQTICLISPVVQILRP